MRHSANRGRGKATTCFVVYLFFSFNVRVGVCPTKISRTTSTSPSTPNECSALWLASAQLGFLLLIALVSRAFAHVWVFIWASWTRFTRRRDARITSHSRAACELHVVCAHSLHMHRCVCVCMCMCWEAPLQSTHTNSLYAKFRSPLIVCLRAKSALSLWLNSVPNMQYTQYSLRIRTSDSTHLRPLCALWRVHNHEFQICVCSRVHKHTDSCYVVVACYSQNIHSHVFVFVYFCTYIQMPSTFIHVTRLEQHAYI